VWSVALRITTVPTLSAMKHLFKSCYKTHHKALSDLFTASDLWEAVPAVHGADGAELPTPAREKALQEVEHRLKELGLFTLEEFQKFLHQTSQERSGLRGLEWANDHYRFVKAKAAELEGVSPELFDITYTIDFDAWLRSNQRTLGLDDLKHLSRSYQWAIEKLRADARRPMGEEGETWLLTRFLANSVQLTDQQRSGEQHHWRNQLTGSYTAGTRLFAAGGHLVGPPHQSLVRLVDAALIRSTLDVWSVPGVGTLTAEEKTENLEHLERMQESAARQAAQCSVCKGIMDALNSIGSISRKDTQNEQERERANAKTSAKGAEISKHRLHMQDPAFREQHKQLELSRFWCAWTERSSTIQLHRLQRSAEGRLKELGPQVPYHAHPAQLCSSKWHPSIYRSQDRVDVTCLREHGPPQVGHFAVLRAQGQNEPYMLGQIVALHARDAQADAERWRQRRDVRMDIAFRQYEPGIMRIPAPAIHPRLARLEQRDEELLAAMRVVRLRQHGLSVGRDSLLPPPPFEIRASQHAPSSLGQPTSLGLFATRDIAKGEFIDFYSIFLTHQSVYAGSSISRSHVCKLPNSSWCLDGMPMASALTRYSAEDAGAHTRVLLMKAGAFLPSAMYAHAALSHPTVAGMLARFHELPKGCLINSPGHMPNRVNCRRIHNKQDFSENISCQLGLEIPYIAAKTDILRGQELLCAYKNDEERDKKWRPHPVHMTPSPVEEVSLLSCMRRSMEALQTRSTSCVAVVRACLGAKYAAGACRCWRGRSSAD